ncbi:MAG TPA: hypothetical protein VM242_15870 [Acidimicrobiales bacterium]|jgi:Flp pilus assembly pilin Flp|nr:hypothetical protein [Acidimicrobiales bacterium]
MTTLFVLVSSFAGLAGGRRPRTERGQASAEYALVLLGVAAVALLVSAWAAKTDGIGRLFDAVMDKLVDSVK